MLKIVCASLLVGSALATPHTHSDDDLGLPKLAKDRVILDEYKFPYTNGDGVSGAVAFSCFVSLFASRSLG